MNASFTFEAIGSWWNIQFETPAHFEALHIEKLKKEMLDRIEEYDRAFSRFRPDSAVSLQSAQQSYTFPPYAHELFTFYQKMEKLTDGLFTAQVGKLLSDLGYDAEYSLGREKKVSAQSKNMDNALDYGAAGKGHLVHLLGEILQDSGYSSYLINGSGDITHSGLQAIRVGLENPNDTQKIIGVTTIQNTSICGSAPNRRRWNKYHHILNPKTNLSPTHIAATWVISKSTLEADGLATALFVCSQKQIEKLKSAFDFEYLILYTNGDIQKSTKFVVELFT